MIVALNRRDAAIRSLSISPRFTAMSSPVILIGMHRAGTSLVAGMLSILGVFFDPSTKLLEEGQSLQAPTAENRRNGYCEAEAFRLTNEALLARAGASWCNVEPFLQNRDNPIFARINCLQLQKATFGRLERGYRYALPKDYNGAWGWKDPCNSLTLPYWLSLFPDAKIVHIRRDPESIARSLIARASTGSAAVPPSLLTRVTSKLKHPVVAVKTLGRKCGLFNAPVSRSLSMVSRMDCMRLNNLYVLECLQYQRYGNQYQEIWYEDILQNPQKSAERLADWAALKPETWRIQQAANFVKPTSR